MKTFSVAVAVVVLLAFMSSAVPVTEVLTDPEEPMSYEYEETSAETWMMPFNIRGEQQSGAIKCHFCCSCCAFGVCGTCCTY
uniref:Hepcidin-like antimicrobial peptide n=1 Tax=Epinephelus fuscoguttatus TaxID=293821 RepID=F1CNA5_EPIFO|nr:hepcidin-like antimicrobial peptide precursor [Epinephelus fuscoguttatus]